MPKDTLNKIVENLSKLSVSEAADLSKLLEGPIPGSQTGGVIKQVSNINEEINGYDSRITTAETEASEAKNSANIAENKAPKKYLVILGYSGWGDGQLEGEMEVDHWILSELDPIIIFEKEPTNKWLKAYENSFIRL